MHGVMLQTFHWYLPSDGHFRRLADDAASLARAGFTSVWIPPAYKGAGGEDDVGYSVYDLFDLGEFDQKGSVRTKYGTKDELVRAVRALRDAGLQVYADVVFNHKSGADAAEDVHAQPVHWHDRNAVAGDWRTIKAWTHFEFQARAGRYSSFRWFWWCFDSVSFDQNHPERSNRELFRLKDKSFETEVSHENGNYDYLMASDLDMGSEFVRGELLYWGDWFLRTTEVDGFRIDAVKHIRASYFAGWLSALRARHRRELFSVGEYWSADVDALHRYIELTQRSMSLFDVPLHYRFREASLAGPAYDLRTIFQRTLVAEQPTLAVTFVDNHDTQPCQSLESWVEPWFKPIAYALILLRREGYPCVFAADYDETSRYRDKGREATLYSHRFLIDVFLSARRDYGYGEQHDYFDHPNTVGWLRTGDAAHPGIMAVVISNGRDGHKWMNTFRPHARFRDATGHIAAQVQAQADGWARFSCPDGSLSVWLSL